MKSIFGGPKWNFLSVILYTVLYSETHQNQTEVNRGNAGSPWNTYQTQSFILAKQFSPYLKILLLQRQEIGEIFNAKSNTESWFCGLLL
jgi:hypothetical protein